MYIYPAAYCPYPTNYYSVAVGNFSTDLESLRCPFSSKKSNGQTNEFGGVETTQKSC